MFDIHSHTLWNLDDGSPDLETTLGMCDIAFETGTDTLFLTPHIVYWEEAESTLYRRNEKTDSLRRILLDERIDIELVKGFEIMCDDEIFEVRNLEPFTLGHSRYLLIEFNFWKTEENDVSSWCSFIQSNGLVPVIAHPERYGFIQDDISVLDRLSEKGVLFQINSGSPLGMFGDLECDISLMMLKNGYVDFIGSDAHNTQHRNTAMGEMISYYPEDVSDRVLELATEINPALLIEDKDIKPKRLHYMAGS